MDSPVEVRACPIGKSKETEVSQRKFDFIEDFGEGAPTMVPAFDVSFRHEAVVHMVLQFLGVKNTISDSRLQGAFLRIHDAACENRIAHWNEVKELLRGTMSLRACNMLSAGGELSSDTPCTKFLVLTTQRSRSASFCENLCNHPEVYCPQSELLVDFSFRQYKEFVSPEEWTRAADAAFARVCSDAEQQGKQIAGFQLMYNQVKGPFQTVEKIKFPEAWFKNYLLKSQVRVLHLVREAVILRLASNFPDRTVMRCPCWSFKKDRVAEVSRDHRPQAMIPAFWERDCHTTWAKTWWPSVVIPLSRIWLTVSQRTTADRFHYTRTVQIWWKVIWWSVGFMIPMVRMYIIRNPEIGIMPVKANSISGSYD